VAARRDLQRGFENPNREFYRGDKRVAHYRKTGEIVPPGSYAAPKFNLPTIQLSTDGEYLPYACDETFPARGDDCEDREKMMRGWLTVKVPHCAAYNCRIAILTRKWLPTLDTLRNFFYAPTAEMKITFDLLRQGSLAG
jgi:hypothetical protein